MDLIFKQNRLCLWQPHSKVNPSQLELYDTSLVTSSLELPSDCAFVWAAPPARAKLMFHSRELTTPTLLAPWLRSLSRGHWHNLSNNKQYIFFIHTWETENLLVQPLQVTYILPKRRLLLSLTVAGIGVSCLLLLGHSSSDEKVVYPPLSIRFEPTGTYGSRCLHVDTASFPLVFRDVWWQCRQQPTAVLTTALSLSFLFIVKNKTIGPKWSCLC